MNWLITGGCGFIGTRLINALLTETGHSIRVLDNLCVGQREDLSRIGPLFEGKLEGPWVSEKLHLLVGDVVDEAVVAEAVDGADVIVHLAANTGVGPSVEDPRLDCMNNVLGTFNVLEAARLQAVPRVIFASSGAPIGEVDPPIHEELATHPVSPYGASKLAGEAYCSAYARTFGLETVALRFGNVYGPGSKRKQSVVAKFIRQALAGETLEIYGDGSQTRDFIFIDDLIHALLLAARADDVAGEVFQIASNRETSIDELASDLTGALSRYGIKQVPVVHLSPRRGDVKRNYSDTSKARDRLGWSSQTSLIEGLQITIKDFLARECEQHV